MEPSLLLLPHSQINISKINPDNLQNGPRSTQEPARLSRPSLRIQHRAQLRLCLGSKFESTPPSSNDTFGSGESMENLHMQESLSKGAISRRSTRIFMEEQLTLESGNNISSYDMRCSSKEEIEKENGQRDMSTSVSSDISPVPTVNLGKDLCNIFPTTPDTIGKQGTYSLHNIIRLSCL